MFRALACVLGLSLINASLGFVQSGRSSAVIGARIGGARRSLVERFSTESDEEAEIMAEAEIYKKQYKKTGLVNADGVPYAPWMDIDEMAIEKARTLRAERKRAERKKSEADGSLWRDSTGGEVSGVGLKKKVVDGQVELEWTTGSEEDCVGFIVAKTAAGERTWQEVASYKDWQPLASKGPNGGTYTYRDPTTELGTFYYRVSEVDASDNRLDLCQVLVDVQSDDEQAAAKVAVFGAVGVFLALVAAGSLIDPMQ